MNLKVNAYIHSSYQFQYFWDKEIAITIKTGIGQHLEKVILNGCSQETWNGRQQCRTSYQKKHAAKVEYFCTFGRRTFPFLGEKSFTISEVFRSDSGADNRKRGRRSWLNTGFNFVQDWHTRLLHRLSVFALSTFDGVLLAQSDSSVDRIAPRIFWHPSVFLWFLTLEGFSSYCYFRLSHRSFQLS